MSQKTELRHALAEALGEDAKNLQAAAPRWLKLMQEGILVNLHIGRWRAKTRLTWSDLGIGLDKENDKELQKIISLGHKKLLPTAILKELDAIESAARKWLEKKAFRTHWGFFIPATAYPEWKEKNEEYRERYFAARDDLLRNYDQIIQDVLDGYRLAAHGAYDRLKVLHPEHLERFANQKAFVKAFIQGIQAHLQPANFIGNSFYFEIGLRYIPLPSLLAEDWAEKQRIEAEATTERLQVWAEQELVRDQLAAEQAKMEMEVELKRSAVEHKNLLMREMHRDVVEQARRQKEEQIDGFLKDVVAQLRNTVYNATIDILAAIKKNNRMPPRSVVQIKNLVNQVNNLNFYGDKEIDQMINQVAGYLDQEIENRDLGDIQAKLQDIATVTRASLIGLGQKPRLARDLARKLVGIADEPSQEMVRQARRGLELDTTEEISDQMIRRASRQLNN